MIALDSSAIVAIALCEPEEEEFNRQIASQEALVGTPTLLETHLVLMAKLDYPDRFLERFLAIRQVHPVAFSLPMYFAAIEAYRRFGRGTGHPAKLNFGDCMSYAVARDHNVPLLYKGDDFAHTDLRSALP